MTPELYFCVYYCVLIVFLIKYLDAPLAKTCNLKTLYCTHIKKPFLSISDKEGFYGLQRNIEPLYQVKRICIKRIDNAKYL